MIIRLEVALEEVLMDGENCGCSKEQLKEAFESLLNSQIIDGWKEKVLYQCCQLFRSIVYNTSSPEANRTP